MRLECCSHFEFAGPSRRRWRGLVTSDPSSCSALLEFSCSMRQIEADCGTAPLGDSHVNPTQWSQVATGPAGPWLSILAHLWIVSLLFGDADVVCTSRRPSQGRASALLAPSAWPC